MNIDQIVFDSSLRPAGNMSLRHADASLSLENRRIFLSPLSINWQELVCAKQVHGDTIRIVDSKDAGKGARDYDDAFEDTDGFITDQKNLPLAILTADCLTVFLHDPCRNVVGILHAGWRGSQKKITAGAITLMQQKFGVNPADILMYLGPSIRSCCCEVQETFKELFPGSVIQKEKRYYLDMPLVNKKQAIGLGVLDRHIFDIGRCTVCSGSGADFFSYRREKERCGRGLSVIMLKG
ncbi:MAG: peptidoglycan editing factor PgeF [Chitinivibrionales bacterium]|nr:peptidoglycan editing factor PgeF [Chitinivibrionales bacterium]